MHSLGLMHLLTGARRIQIAKVTEALRLSSADLYSTESDDLGIRLSKWVFLIAQRVD